MLTNPAGFYTLHNMTDAGGISSAVDSTTYYVGAFLIFDVDASYLSHAAYAPLTCRITSMRNIFVNGGNPGAPSTHRVTYAIRVNDATDYVISTTQDWRNSTIGLWTGLSIPLQEGQTYAVKISTPTWSTNPAVIFNSIQLGYSVP